MDTKSVAIGITVTTLLVTGFFMQGEKDWSKCGVIQGQDMNTEGQIKFKYSLCDEWLVIDYGSLTGTEKEKATKISEQIKNTIGAESLVRFSNGKVEITTASSKEIIDSLNETK